MRKIVAVLLSTLALGSPSRAAGVPSPEEILGFRPGADFHLATWKQVTQVIEAIDRASDRVVVRELGKTTEGRPLIVAFVSSPETIADLETYRSLQQKIADPRGLDDKGAREAVDRSKAVVVISCSIHSSETASTLMAVELLHELATKDDANTKEILDRTILILVPSANPDGVEKVARWYDRTKGKPWEGGGMPELYHKYAGHDTNRDWFMLNLKETQLLTGLYYKEWFPTLLYDVHQMGSAGARLFVPPFFDPINPNLDPKINQGIALIGSHMASDLAVANKRGILTNAMYDNWWNGGNRTTPQRHNIVAVLTEAASVRLASPIFLEKDQLKGGSRGFADHRQAVNFVDPWPGGWWRLRDIVDYELICSRSILRLAARYRPEFQSNYLALGREAVSRGQAEPPFAWVVPSDQDDPGRAAEMVRILQDTGIEARRARSPFQADGLSYPAGSWVMLAAQPYRAHLKDMMERQVYPARFTASGAAEPPYDVAGWTLPLQMGVRSATVSDRFEADLDPPADAKGPTGRIEGPSDPKAYLLKNESDDDFRVLNAALAEGIEVRMETQGYREKGIPIGALRLPASEKVRKLLDRVLPKTSSLALATPEEADSGPAHRSRRTRIGLYQPWVPSMDEGWTRLVLEKFDFPYKTLHNADVRAGDLKSRFDTIILPSVSTNTLRNGWKADETAPAYVGGLGEPGSEALRAFVREGGTLVCLEASCDYAISEFKLGVKEVLHDLPSSKFYGPGSIVRITYETGYSRWRRPEVLGTLGLSAEGSAYFDRSLAFENPQSDHVHILARYADRDVLQSGWLLGPDYLHGKAAVVVVQQGNGRVILFGFPPQHRGQTRGHSACCSTRSCSAASRRVHNDCPLARGAPPPHS